MSRDWREDLARSTEAFERVVWPAIKDSIGGGTVRMTEGSRDGTDLMLDQEGGIDAWQRTERGTLRALALRVQDGTFAKNWTTTTRYRRDSGALTQHAKQLRAVEENGNLPSLTIHAYVTADRSRLILAGIIETKALVEHMSKCFSGSSSSNSGCFERRTSNATFIASDWRHLMAAGVPVVVVAPGQPCMHPSEQYGGPGLVWGCRTETLDLSRVVNSLVKCRACGSWSTAPRAAAGGLRGTGT